MNILNDKTKNDKTEVLKAVKQCGLEIRLASDELKKDFEVVLEAVYQNAGAFEFVDQEIKDMCDTIGYKQAFNKMQDYVKREKFAQSLELKLTQKVDKRKSFKI